MEFQKNMAQKAINDLRAKAGEQRRFTNIMHKLGQLMQQEEFVLSEALAEVLKEQLDFLGTLLKDAHLNLIAELINNDFKSITKRLNRRDIKMLLKKFFPKMNKEGIPSSPSKEDLNKLINTYRQRTL